MKIEGFALALLALCAGAQAGTRYQVVDTGTIAQPGTLLAINESGQLAGTHLLPGTSTLHGFVYRDGAAEDVTLPGSPWSQAQAINDAGDATGFIQLPDGTVNAFLYRAGVVRPLGSLGSGYSYGAGIDESGRVAGYSGTAAAENHAFFYADGVMHDLGAMGGTGCYVYALSKADRITGSVSYTPTLYRAFIYGAGGFDSLGTLGGTSSGANAINNFGYAVGFSYVAGDAASHAFLYRQGAMVDLTPDLDGTSSAFGVNDLGSVVGFAVNSRGMHQFLHRQGRTFDLNKLLDPASGWVLTSAFDINNSGQIAGIANFRDDGVYHNVRLDPIEAPGSDEEALLKE